MHMGQPIKDMLAALGLPPSALVGTPEERSAPQPSLGGKSARTAMQTLGTDWGRVLIWEEIWAQRLRQELRDGGEERLVVVDDLRFPSDWRVIQEFGGVIATVTRPGFERRRSFLAKVAYRFRSLGRIAAAAGLPVPPESEFHWRDAPSLVTIVNAGDADELVEDLERQLRSRGIRLGSELEVDRP